MPQIPVYDNKVSLDGGSGTPTPRLTPAPAAASGANIAEGIEGIGKTISSQASELSHVIAYKQKLDSQEKVDALAEKAASELHAKANGDGGWLTREGDAAKGISAGFGDTIKFKDSFEGVSSELKKTYLAQAKDDFERRLLNKALDSHERVYRNAVVTHEAKQAKVARAAASEAAVLALKNTGTDAVTVGDLDHVIDEGSAERERALRNEGHTDESIISAIRTKTADEFADAAVHANLDRDPAAAQALLDGVKGKMSPITVAKLQGALDGKMIALRSDAINTQIAENPASRNADGFMDLGAVTQQAAELAKDRPAAERDRLVKMAKEQAGIANAALLQQKKQSVVRMQDAFAELRDKNVPYPEAEQRVLTKFGGVFGPSELDKLREQGVKIYQRDPDAIKNRLKTMNDDQQSGYQTATDIIKSRYSLNTKELLEGEDNKMTPGRIMLRQLDKIAPSMSGTQIKTWVTEQLKDVPTKPGFLNWLPGGPYFTGKKEAWREQASLESRYGSEKIAIARNEIMKSKGGKLPTYVELEEKLRGR